MISSQNEPLDRKRLFSRSKRVVIKVGSAVLASPDTGLDQGRIEVSQPRSPISLIRATRSSWCRPGP